MLIDSSIHNHSTYCDGKSTPREMVESAFRAGFSDFGVLCHATMSTGDYDWPIRDEKGFQEALSNLKKEYQGKMRIYCGLERDYYGKDSDGFDYKIDAVHQIYYRGKYFDVDHSVDIFKRDIEFGFGGDVQKYVKVYYETVCKMIEKVKPTYLCHVDLVTKFNDGYQFFNEEDSWYQNLVKECLIFAIENNSLIEMNFGAMTRGVKKTPYPARYLLDFIKRHKGRIIVGGDCHNALYTSFGMKEGEELLKAHGFNSVTLFRNGKYIEVGL